MVTAAKLPEAASLPLGAGMVESRVHVVVETYNFLRKNMLFTSKCAECTED